MPKNKIYCSVCRVSFVYREEVSTEKVVICPVCGARLEIVAVSPEIEARRLPQDPQEEIYDRVHNFADLKGYVFGPEKEEVMEGLLQKNELYGDFFCPCRFDNIPENICPCLETRRNQVRKEGSCL